MIDLFDLLHPPKNMGNTVEEVVDYIKKSYVQSEYRNAIKRIETLLPELPISSSVRDLHHSLFERYRILGEMNSLLLKEHIGDLIRYKQELFSKDTPSIEKCLLELEAILSRISMSDPSHLGRKLDAIERKPFLRDAPGLRPEVGINDTDYKLQRLSIDLTTKCNYNCLKCFRSESTKTKSIDLDFNLLKRLIDEGLEMGIQDFGLMGGEPTLYNNFDDMLRYFQKRANNHKGLPFYVILFTNGSRLFTTEERRNLIRNCPFLDVWFTIETFDRALYPIVHGCADHYFEQVMRNLAYAIDNGLAQETRLCITYPQSKNNLVFSEEVWRFCRQTGILPRFTFVAKVGKARELLSDRILTDDERAKIIEAVVDIDASLGYETTYSYNGIGINPFRAYNFIAFDATGRTWDFYINIAGLDFRRYSLLQIWNINLKRLNDCDFLKLQSGSPYKLTREFAQRRLSELKKGIKV
jgi:MoaA/NifB/PqqE/SkfB family radical SAM enzyme